MNIFSIVIPCYNEEKRIKTLLNSIRNSKTLDFEVEVILVDNGSQDQTVSVAKPFCDKIEILPDMTIAGLRNSGVQLAKGKYIGFIDSDCKPNVDWAWIAKNHLDQNPAIGVVGSFYAMTETETPNWIEKAWFEMKKRRSGSVNFLPAGNCAVRKEDFLALRGFSESLVTGEDYDLCLKYRRAGFVIWNDPALAAIHYGNVRSLKELFMRELWYGQGMLQTIRNGAMSKPFVAANMILLGWIIILAAVVSGLLGSTNYAPWIITGMMFVAIPVFLAAIRATIQSGKFYGIVYYLPIFFVYMAGRTLSLFLIYSGQRKRSK